jgi:4-amino-4-deoxy-L-arabinose transferase-like glycosyltransferase
MTVAEQSLKPSSTWAIWFTLALYTGVRLALLPGADPAVGGFRHDSAYITLVAQNLLAGRGYVNDAHWLVFLHPESLPMPFHNANPLHPTLIAMVAGLTGVSVITAGFAISALSSSLLFAALFLLARTFTTSVAAQVFAAAAGTFFSPVFADSLTLLPDALSLGLTMAFLTCLVRMQQWRFVLLGGIFFGLAWLTRSSAILVLPAAVVYLVLMYGWKWTTARLTGFGITAILVAMPWLVHTAVVWGSPWRSDASYYLWQNYHAQKFDGSVAHFWHSTELPPTPGELLRHEPGAVTRHVLRGIPVTLFKTIAEWSYANYAVAALLGLLALFASAHLVKRLPAETGERRKRLAVLVSAAVYALTVVLAFAPRAGTFELRYLVLLSVLFALLLLYGTCQAVAGLRSRSTHARALSFVFVVLSVLLWFVAVPYRNVRLYQQNIAVNAAQEAYLMLARTVHEEFGGRGPMVVGNYPYFYTLATGAQSLSIPVSDDAGLLAYMKRYQACYIFLTQAELEFWRPRWRNHLPAELFRCASLDEATVFAQTETP